jgi:hypothetical protein
MFIEINISQVAVVGRIEITVQKSSEFIFKIGTLRILEVTCTPGHLVALSTRYTIGLLLMHTWTSRGA